MKTNKSVERTLENYPNPIIFLDYSLNEKLEGSFKIEFNNYTEWVSFMNPYFGKFKDVEIDIFSERFNNFLEAVDNLNSYNNISITWDNSDLYVLNIIKDLKESGTLKEYMQKIECKNTTELFNVLIDYIDLFIIQTDNTDTIDQIRLVDTINFLSDTNELLDYITNIIEYDLIDNREFYKTCKESSIQGNYYSNYLKELLEELNK